MERTYNLWREYPSAPYLRWACAVVEDETTPSGYRISDYDQAIADPGFVHNLTEHLGKPTQGMKHVPFPDKKGHVDLGVALMPGEHMHLAEAVRQVPGALVGPARGEL